MTVKIKGKLMRYSIEEELLIKDNGVFKRFEFGPDFDYYKEDEDSGEFKDTFILVDVIGEEHLIDVADALNSYIEHLGLRNRK